MLDGRRLSTPDLTPAQIVGQIPAIVAALVALGFVDDATAQAVVAGVGAAITIAWLVADAVIRHGRATAAAAATVAQVQPLEFSVGVGESGQSGQQGQSYMVDPTEQAPAERPRYLNPDDPHGTNVELGGG